MADLSRLNRVTSLHRGSFGGSVILDGTAYSGADIKAVVHIYDKGKTLQEQIDEIQQAIDAATGFNRDTSLLQNQLAFLERNAREFGNSTRISTKTLAEIQTLSISTYREKHPVRGLGATYPKAHTRGSRTIAGSMVFTVFDRDVMFEILEADPTDFDSFKITSAIIDQLPPFDITISFANELGQLSRMAILGVEFVSSGQTMSIHDMFIENAVQYVALDFDPMTLVGVGKIDENNRITGVDKLAVSGSELLKGDKAEDYKKLTDSFSARFKRRNNPFV